jgi:serine-type D-Ala-D-Ala carboxypeptidase/endopeptidase (penicillin-binding protein 4)
MKTLYLFICSMFCVHVYAQNISIKLSQSIEKLQADSQFKHAAISFYVVDTKTGNVIFNKNEDMGLAPASCQKVITSATAFELLGNNYRYKTTLEYNGTLEDGLLNGNILLKGTGDPAFGSWRWNETKEQIMLKKITAALVEKGIKKIKGQIVYSNDNWESNSTPGGWVWDDIGNYYGAGASAINWHENQYDLILRSGNAIGSMVKIKSTRPALEDVILMSEVTAAKKGSGDNAYIYLAPQSTKGYVRGTIPVEEDNFIISGAMPDPAKQLQYELKNALKENSIEIDPSVQKTVGVKSETLFTHISPSLDSINYWFLKKSINLYGEAFVKTIAFEKTKFGSTEKGVELIKDFWSHHGIESSAINIKDGSGLSPANRVTTKALVAVLQFAKQQQWFRSFYHALPEINNIKMKDGYIADVRSYTGFIKDKSGKEYTFSFIVNNFDGSASAARIKMWQVLDILK